MPDEEESYSSQPKSGFSGFTALADTNDVGGLSEEEEGAGGLMVCVMFIFFYVLHTVYEGSSLC